MIIKMTGDKQLLVTVPSTIYRGENNADLLTFYVPAHYDDIDIAGCATTMRYIRPDGTGTFETLRIAQSPYEDYIELSTKANAQFTGQAGVMSVWLTFLDANDTTVLKTGEVKICIEDSKDIHEYFDPEELDSFDKLAVRIEQLDASKADNVDLDDHILRLTSNGTPVGDAVVLEGVSWSTF